MVSFTSPNSKTTLKILLRMRRSQHVKKCDRLRKLTSDFEIAVLWSETTQSETSHLRLYGLSWRTHREKVPFNPLGFNKTFGIHFRRSIKNQMSWRRLVFISDLTQDWSCYFTFVSICSCNRQLFQSRLIIGRKRNQWYFIIQSFIWPTKQKEDVSFRHRKIFISTIKKTRKKESGSLKRVMKHTLSKLISFHIAWSGWGEF